MNRDYHNVTLRKFHEILETFTTVFAGIEVNSISVRFNIQSNSQWLHSTE